jgi:inosine/xanthosine triphosphate pyrophosphatase family protein
VRECHRTFAEIGPSYKAIVSHRGRALRAMLPLLVKALRDS